MQFAAIVAGVSGYEGTRARQSAGACRRSGSRCCTTRRSRTPARSHGEPGIVVIAGTGSRRLRPADRQSRGRAGGWGYLFGDEGSAFWLAREALAALMRWEDERTPHGDEVRAACDFFGLPSLRGVARAFYRGRDRARGLAAFAPVAMRFEPFRAIADRGADRLAALVRPAVEAGRLRRCAFVGRHVRATHGFARRFERRSRKRFRPRASSPRTTNRASERCCWPIVRPVSDRSRESVARREPSRCACAAD